MKTRLTCLFFSLFALVGAVSCGGGEGGERTPNDVEKTDGGGSPIPSKDGGTTGALNCKNLAEVEQKLIVPTCGKSGCHDGADKSPPPQLHKVGDIVGRLLDKPGMMWCKSDNYIDKSNVMKSYLLAKVAASSLSVTCPSGGTQGNGGIRMPSDMTTGLSTEQVECFRTYVAEAAKQ
jgi:hypothetical protein